MIFFPSNLMLYYLARNGDMRYLEDVYFNLFRYPTGNLTRLTEKLLEPDKKCVLCPIMGVSRSATSLGSNRLSSLFE